MNSNNGFSSDGRASNMRPIVPAGPSTGPMIARALGAAMPTGVAGGPPRAEDGPGVADLKRFLADAPKLWSQQAGEPPVRKYKMANGEEVSCVYWRKRFFVTGTDVVKVVAFRFQAAGRSIMNPKKFEEGVFSDLRNLKPGTDAVLEEPRSEFLEFLHRNGCIRTQKKQKVFFWERVPHESLYLEALERNYKRATNMLSVANLLAAPDLLRQYMMFGGAGLGGMQSLPNMASVPNMQAMSGGVPNTFAGVQNNFTNVQGGFAGVQGGFAGVQGGFASVQNGFAPNIPSNFAGGFAATLQGSTPSGMPSFVAQTAGPQATGGAFAARDEGFLGAKRASEEPAVRETPLDEYNYGYLDLGAAPSPTALEDVRAAVSSPLCGTLDTAGLFGEAAAPASPAGIVSSALLGGAAPLANSARPVVVDATSVPGSPLILDPLMASVGGHASPVAYWDKAPLTPTVANGDDPMGCFGDFANGIDGRGGNVFWSNVWSD